MYQTVLASIYLFINHFVFNINIKINMRKNTQLSRKVLNFYNNSYKWRIPQYIICLQIVIVVNNIKEILRCLLYVVSWI